MSKSGKTKGKKYCYWMHSTTVMFGWIMLLIFCTTDWRMSMMLRWRSQRVNLYINNILIINYYSLFIIYYLFFIINILITKFLQGIQCCHFKTRKSNCEMWRIKNTIKAETNWKDRSSYESNFVVFKIGHFFNFVIEFIPFSEGWYHHSHSHWINKTGDGLVLGLYPFLLHAYI